MKQIKSFNGLKFFTALIIVLLHTGDFRNFHIKDYPFRCGYLAVELFFILAGFLLARTYEKMSFSPVARTNTSTKLCKTYFFHRFNRLWPEYLLATVMFLSLSNTFFHVKIQPFFLNMVMMAGWGGVHVIYFVLWFVPVLFWCGCFLFNLLALEKEKSKNIIFPLIAVFCLFCLVDTKDHLPDILRPSFGYLSVGTIRGLLGLIIGIYTYWGCQALKSSKINWRPRFVTIALFIGEVISITGLGYIFIFQKKFTMNLFNVYFYISFLIGLLYFQKEKLLKFLSWKIWIPFSTISYSLYLTHEIIVRIFVVYLRRWTHTHVVWGSVLIVLLSVIFAFFCYYTQLGLRKALKKLAFKK